MRTLGHVITSAGVSLATYARYRSPGAALASLLAGTLIDLDHIFDYVKAHGWKFSWFHFNEACHEKYSGKLYLPLHRSRLTYFLGNRIHKGFDANRLLSTRVYHGTTTVKPASLVKSI